MSELPPLNPAVTFAPGTQFRMRGVIQDGGECGEVECVQTNFVRPRDNSRMEIPGREKSSLTSLLKATIRGACYIALLAITILPPAGSWNWQRVIQFAVLYLIVLGASLAAFNVVAPVSVEGRPPAPGAKRRLQAEQVVSTFLLLLVLAWFVIIPVDVFRLRLLPPPALWVSICGAGLLAAGFGIALTAALQEESADPIVKGQSERGRLLVDTGLYGHIRHPLNAGLILLLTGVPLWLESYSGVVVLPLILGLLAVRVCIEEAKLRETLPGYGGYMKKVRYRLVPLVW